MAFVSCSLKVLVARHPEDDYCAGFCFKETGKQTAQLPEGDLGQPGGGVGGGLSHQWGHLCVSHAGAYKWQSRRQAARKLGPEAEIHWSSCSVIQRGALPPPLRTETQRPCSKASGSSREKKTAPHTRLRLTFSLARLVGAPQMNYQCNNDSSN